jgi:AraC-like DNA-binding protein
LSARADYWRSGITEHYFPMRLDSIGPGGFEARLAGGPVGPVAVRSISGFPHRVVRTPRMVAAADPECFLLYLVRSGSCRIAQDSRMCVLGPGDIGGQDTSRPSMFEAQATFDVLAFTFPKWFIGSRADDIARRTATRAAGCDEPFVRIATPFLAGLARAAEGGGVTGPEGDGAAEMLLPLLRNLYSDRRTGSVAGPDTLLRQMKQYVTEHLCDPDLAPGTIARAHYVSTRYVHKLFASCGTGVSAWIRERRLEGAARDLRDSGASIADVAAIWGWHDPSSFSRAFRKAHGCSPRELRRTVAGE